MLSTQTSEWYWSSRITSKCWIWMDLIFLFLWISWHPPLDLLFFHLQMLRVLFEYTFMKINSKLFIFVFFTDALLRKAFTTPSFQGYNFVSSLLVLLGLIKVCTICTYSATATETSSLSLCDVSCFFYTSLNFSHWSFHCILHCC